MNDPTPPKQVDEDDTLDEITKLFDDILMGTITDEPLDGMSVTPLELYSF